MHVLKYTVASIHRGDFPAKALMGAKTIDIKVPGLIVEAVSEDESMGHTFRFIPDDIEAAEAEFAVGSSINVALSGAE